MAGSPVKDEVDHRVKPDPAADSNASGVASIPPAHTADVNPVEPSFGNPSSVCNHHLEQLVSSSSVSELEAAVQVGARLLEDLKEPLNATQGAGDSQVAHWLQCIQQVEQKAKPARTVVGVVGVTGAGKSSVINALLDEERLVPTSGMRACTASATEISYNHSDDPHELYRAEVEFISADDWSQELKTLLGDLIDGTGNISPDCYNPDTDAGLAYSKIRAKELEVDEKVLHEFLTKLDISFCEAVEDCLSSMKHDLEKHLYKAFDTLLPIASGSAVDTAIGWGKPRSENGLLWCTYNATCRRDGSWHSWCGAKDFNAELFEPINKQLAASWERVFQRRIPQTLRAFTEECKSILETFHSDVTASVLGASGASSTTLNVLDQQKRTYQKTLDATPKFVGAKIKENQREANRGFTPVVQAAMQPAYDACAGERGKGMFIRMKSIMETHVNMARNTMFRQACDSVKGQLDSMCAGIEQLLTMFVKDLVTKLQRDYLATLVGRCVEASAEVPLAERMLRGQIRPILDDADSRFAEFCFPARRATSATAAGSEREESLIAQQLQDVMAQHQEDVSDSGTDTGVKPEPL